ncbi:MAG: tripartite transporter [Hyphomonas sp.]|uniref:TRAP transporter large permease n=1 Tax=Hyphomonas sp. TaxID=87 RepID=UPI001D1C8991|nr:TRAP transporter large permease subunit [Hyphomonas sp.]MBA4226309.1 tripartite transporter [Hyphomonas sp.]
MELEAILAISMFVVAIGALLAGYPVALTLGGVALIFALIGIATGVFPESFLKAFPSRIEGGSIMQSQTLVAVPLFVIMGVILERSRVAEDLLNIASRLLGKMRGGLGFAVVLVGTLLAASTGIVGATVITMTLIALPSMMRQGYDPRLATGTIAASGTLGQIIPPSIVLILLADAISNAASQAALRSGGGSAVVSVGDLFAGALIPGLILVALYLLWIALMAIFRPESCPPAKVIEGTAPLSFRDVALGLGAPLALIVAVLGSILGGIAPPTEAAAIGAGGAILLAGMRLAREAKSRLMPVMLAGLAGILLIIVLRNTLDLRTASGGHSGADFIGMAITVLAALAILAALVAGLLVLRRVKQLGPALKSSAHITSMVFLILIGASLFSLVFRGFDGDDLVHDILHNVPGGKWGALAAAMLVMFILGFFLDFIEIVFVVVPLVAPPLILLGCDPVWLGILMAVNLQTSFLTPPFGFALFYLRGAAPPEVSTMQIWQGALPFIGLQVILLAMVASMPALATWLPALAAK